MFDTVRPLKLLKYAAVDQRPQVFKVDEGKHLTTVLYT